MLIFMKVSRIKHIKFVSAIDKNTKKQYSSYKIAAQQKEEYK